MWNGRGWVARLMVLGLVGCAEREHLPPGNELEFPETPAAPKAEAAPHAAPGGVDGALASAFSGKREASVPTEAPAEAAPPAKQRYAQALQAARPRLEGADLLESNGAALELEPLAKRAGPETEQSLYELEARVRRAHRDAVGAADAAERWLLTCGPSGVAACRRSALAEMVQAAVGRDRPLIMVRAAAIRKHDACLARAGADTSGRLPTCFAAALAFYQSEGDGLMARHALMTRLRAAGHAATPQMFVEADRACREERCYDATRRALRTEVDADLRAGEPRQALLLALQDARAAFASLPPEQAVLARTTEVERACSALDSRTGPSACRHLLHEAESRYTLKDLKDFSKQTAKGEGLSTEAVKEVHDVFAGMIQDCLISEADRLEPPQSERYTLSWVVRNDGRVDQVHLDKHDRDEGPLALCLRGQFTLWRYPRYRGELQHVEQAFVVSARERRPSVASVSALR
jgi:hypothetical protein